MTEEIDTRAKAIESARTERYLLGQFFLVDEGRAIDFQIPVTMREDFDKETLAACLVQLMGRFMEINPDTKPMELMTAIQAGIAGMDG